MLTAVWIFYGFFCAILCILFVASFILRDAPIFKGIWKCFKWFFIIGLLNLGGNYAKKEIKNWWNKD
jgi:hypothetical protein